jgi:predicted nucleic acid-binding Zn ribbon protein
MNQQTQTITDSGLISTHRTCPKCGYIRETAETNCADCGKPMQKVSTMKFLGVVLVALGGSLLAFMGWLSFWAYGTIANPSAAGSHFNGTAKDQVFMIFVFGLIAAIALGVTAGGFWQIVFGKRNKLIVFAVIVLGIVFVVTGLAVAVNK